MHLWSVVPLAGLLACGGREVPVTLQNMSGHDLREVVLTGSGFTDTVAQVAAGQSITVRVQAQGESGLALSFLAEGRQVDHPAAGYFEGDGGYTVQATIDSAFGVDIRSTLR